MNVTSIPILIQWMISIGLFCIGWMTFSLIDSTWHLIFLFVLIPWLHFCVTPLFHLLGIYQYLSAPVFVFKPNNKRYEIHNGNIMDYIHAFCTKRRGESIQKHILRNYANSCLLIINKINRGDLPNTVQIVGCSYFFNMRTANKFGFNIGKTDLVTKFCFYLNLIEIITLYCFVKGRIGIPKVWKVRSYFTTGEILCQKQLFIEKILKNLD